MNTATIEARYEEHKRAEDALEAAINAMYPNGTPVRYRSGRGWAVGTATGNSHRAHLSVLNDRTQRHHRVWFRDVELVASGVGK